MSILPGRRALLASAVLTAPVPLRAQSAPPIRLIVPFAAGGPMDMVARLVAPGAGAHLGQTVVVENRTGGTGAVGMAEVARARPDGTTLMMTGSSWPVVMLLNPNLSFRMTDFAPLTRLTLAPHVFAVPGNLPVRSVAEFVAEAKRRPGEWSYGTSGIGTTLHLGTEMLKRRAGIDLVHVPYRGNAPAMADLLAGRLQTMFPTIAEVTPFLADGRLRALAVGYGERLDTLPDVPTMAEVGLGDVPAASDFGVATGAEVPAAQRERLSEAFRASVRDPATTARLREAGIFVVASTAQRFAQMVAEEGARYAEIIQAANITLN
ncbi:Bug family tripartite tricarboxylate transporter substrate binding protein [Sabulicella glaciei]|uniref:Tripartite tricarboxylate transporter substrate binding protein n=1 Tax=Sabulicella glaciei TaxID=2984948 RepID=A0ABT3NTH5_9PROT|nr:tripartite tricarboxylate transporter substrate binding protein [Roseococcus sp. MDT2-1-1]MCW8085456.1 tripartite tricarboxylate transporter substrate binding protein [Roseococcus sp. MDT2-1-1]